MSLRPRVAMLVCALGFGCVFTSRPQLPSNEDTRTSDAATGALAGHDAAMAADAASPPTAGPDASDNGPADVRDADPCDRDAGDLDAGDAGDAGDADAPDAALLRCDAERDGVAASALGR